MSDAAEVPEVAEVAEVAVDWDAPKSASTTFG